jgi:pectate lyase
MIRKRDGHRSLRAGVVATFGALAIAVLAAGCDEMVKPAEEAPAAAAPTAAPAPAATPAVPQVVPMTAPFRAESGFAWIVQVPVAPTTQKLRVFEDGKELGPGESKHADVREVGMGAYSHWDGGTGSVIYFSTSDNTDPNTNGRTYEAK